MKLMLFVLFVAVLLESIQAQHLRASNLPIVHPFKITCLANNSIIIYQNTSYNLDLFVAGNVSSCLYYKTHFTIDKKKNVTLDSSCMDTKERAFLIEAQDRSTTTTPVSTPATTKPGVMGGKSAIVYRVTCIPDTDGDPVNVTMVPPVSVKATASELVLPDLKIGVFEGSSSPDMTKPKHSVTLGNEVKLVVYNDLKGGLMSFMLIPARCDAYPEGNKQKASLTLLDEGGSITTPCTYESKLLSHFTVTNTTDYDLSYATLYPFTFEGFPDTPVVLECTVYICPKDDVVDGVRSGYCDKTSLNTGTNRCSQVNATSDYSKKRRRRDVGVGDSGVGKATLRATFSVQEPLIVGAGSRCSAGIWGVVATLVYIFK